MSEETFVPPLPKKKEKEVEVYQIEARITGKDFIRVRKVGGDNTVYVVPNVGKRFFSVPKSQLLTVEEFNNKD